MKKKTQEELDREGLYFQLANAAGVSVLNPAKIRQVLWIHFVDQQLGQFDAQHLVDEGCIARDTSQKYTGQDTKFIPSAYRLTKKGFLILTMPQKWIFSEFDDEDNKMYLQLLIQSNQQSESKEDDETPNA